MPTNQVLNQHDKLFICMLVSFYIYKNERKITNILLLLVGILSFLICTSSNK